MRTEHDFLGDLQVPDEVYYGVQTLRGKENFHITGQTIDPEFAPDHGQGSLQYRQAHQGSYSGEGLAQEGIHGVCAVS